MSESKYSVRTEHHLPAPEWTPTQPGDHYMIRADGSESAQVPGQRVVGRVRDDRHHRRIVEVSVPHLPYEPWIDTAGNVKQIPIRTTRVMSAKRTRDGRQISADDGPYIEQTRRQHWRAGWLHFEMGAYGEDRAHWLARRDGEIARRRDEQAQDMGEADERWAEAQRKEPDKTKADLNAAAESAKDGMRERGKRTARLAELEGKEP